MGYTERYPAVHAELVKLRGTLGSSKVGGYSIPALTPADMTGVLGVYTRGLMATITRIANAGVVPSNIVQDGLWTSKPVFTISPQRYLAGYPPNKLGAPWKRTVMLTEDEYAYVASNATWEPAREPSSSWSAPFGLFGGLVERDPQPELVMFLHQAVADYQGAIDAIVATAQTYGGTPSANGVGAFLSKIRPLGADLDVLAENPPTTLVADLQGAMGAAFDASGVALEKAGKTAGEIAGKVGNVAGSIAGATLEGFFDKANLATLGVAAIIVYKVV